MHQHAPDEEFVECQFLEERAREETEAELSKPSIAGKFPPIQKKRGLAEYGEASGNDCSEQFRLLRTRRY